ncbi:ABC transporter permease [Chloroflexota bacterium]
MKFNFQFIGMVLLLAIVAFLAVYPVGTIVYGSFRSGSPWLETHFTLDGYRQAITEPGIMKALWWTFSLAAVRTVIVVLVATFFCWIIVRTDTPGRGILEFVMWINYFLPVLPMTFGWILLLDSDYGLLNVWAQKLPFISGALFNIYSFGGIVWAHLASSISIRVLLFAPAFRNMDASLEESARMSGCSNLGTLMRITFPLLMPSLVGVTLLGFIKMMESFEIELIIGGPARLFVFSTKVFDLIKTDPPQYPPAMALSTIFLVIVVAMILVNRWIIERRQYTTVTGKGYRTTPIRVGKWRWLLFAVCVGYVVIFLVLPFTFLIIGTFMKVTGLFFVSEPYTVKHWQIVLRDPWFIRSLVNSLIMAFSAAVVGMLIYSFISYIIRRTKVRGRGLLDFMTWLPVSLPGILLGIGLLWVFLGSFKILVAFYGTLYIIMLAHIINQMPFGTRMMDGTMVQIGKDLEESAWMSGASRISTFRRIMAPLLVPTYVATSVLIFLNAIRDVVLAVLLYTPKSRVLSVLMLEHYLGYDYEKGMVVGVIITFICIVIAFVARSLGMKRL